DAAVDAARVVVTDAADALVERRGGELVLRAADPLLVGRGERGAGRRHALALGATFLLGLELPAAAPLGRDVDVERHDPASLLEERAGAGLVFLDALAALNHRGETVTTLERPGLAATGAGVGASAVEAAL